MKNEVENIDLRKKILDNNQHKYQKKHMNTNNILKLLKTIYKNFISL